MTFTVQQKVRGGPTTWPPRSPDLIPIYFFRWGYIKDIVHSTPVSDLKDLFRRIVAVRVTVVLTRGATHKNSLVAIQNLESPTVIIFSKRHFHPSIIW